MLDSITSKVFEAIRKTPKGICSLEILESLKFCSRDTLKTLISRLVKANKIIRLKRGTYAALPLTDAFVAAQASFGGYIGFSSALYLHKFTSEIPFKIIIVTPQISDSKIVGEYEFRAVALKEKAVGFEYKADLLVSTLPKTLFDCIYLPNYAVERKKLINAFVEKPLTKKEWGEFDYYVKKFIKKKSIKKFYDIKKQLKG